MSESWNGIADYSEQTLQDYGWLDATAHRILDTIVSLFQQAGVGLPVRQYVASGPESSIVYDCEQLTVTSSQIYLGNPGEPSLQAKPCDLAMSGDFIIELVRCYPVSTPTKRNPDKLEPPSVAKMNQAAQVQFIDAQLLLEAAYNVQSIQGVIAQVNFGIPQGGFQGITLAMSCSLSSD